MHATESGTPRLTLRRPPDSPGSEGGNTRPCVGRDSRRNSKALAYQVVEVQTIVLSNLFFDWQNLPRCQAQKAGDYRLHEVLVNPIGIGHGKRRHVAQRILPDAVAEPRSAVRLHHQVRERRIEQRGDERVIPGFNSIDYQPIKRLIFGGSRRRDGNEKTPEEEPRTEQVGRSRHGHGIPGFSPGERWHRRPGD